MRFKLDENIPIEAVGILRDAGHDTLSVLDQRMGGAKDPLVAQVCRKEERALITFDTDFTDIRAYPPKKHAGIAVLRLKTQEKHYVLRIIRRMVRLLSDDALKGKLWIVEDERIRIRDR